MEVRNEKYSGCLHKGKLTLLRHRDSKPFTFPRRDYSHAITCVELALDFLIYGTKAGDIYYYLLEDEAPQCVGAFHHSGAIKRLWPNNLGTRLIFEDDSELVHVYNPIIQQSITVSGFEKLDSALWDAEDTHVFVISRGYEDFVYVYSPTGIYHSQLLFLGSSIRPGGFYPLALQSGVLTCQLENDDALEDLTLETHNWIKRQPDGEAELRMRFNQNLSLLHFKEAWNDAMLLKSNEVWDMLMKKTLEQMELDLAMKACHQAKTVKFYMSLRSLEHVEDRYLLGGHIMVLLGDYDAAQESFLKSTYPESAVEMRTNLQQWDQALALATQLGSTSTSEIKWGYAQLLERRGEFRHSLAHYQDFMKASLPDSARYSHAKAGVARTLIHVGDIWKGKQIAMECNDRRLYGECARILEGLNLLQDAAELYEMGTQLEKATGLYITVKNYSQACQLLEQLKNQKLYIEYARAMEGERRFSDASAAYEAAEDIENVVRLELGSVKNSFRAFSILYKTRSTSGALVAAKFCKSTGDYDRAIEFLIMGKRTEEAHELAQLHGKMDVYTEFVVDEASNEECLKLAKYYETTANYAQAGLLFERCNETRHALHLYLQWGAAEGIDLVRHLSSKAIAMVGRLKCEALTSQLFEFLMDETRAEKSQQHLFRLYTVLGQYEQATAAAFVIAHREQEAGNYKSAHSLLLDYCKTLQANDKQVPSELLMQLMLLHSYILVKTLIRLNDHKSSARMLIRIVRHISKFPAHVVQILTSAVIECQRSGLKKSAFEYASMLMNPEYRQLISPVYKRKIEKIVRKPEKVEEAEPLQPCPVCLLPIPETQLDCPACGSNIPCCIATGRHMVLDNWTICPSCKFPALMSEFSKMLEVEKMCPMCCTSVAPEDLKPVPEPLGSRDLMTDELNRLTSQNPPECQSHWQPQL